MYKILIIFGFVCVTLVRCEDSYNKCGDSFECVEKEMVQFVDDLDKQDKVPILGDAVTLERRGNVQAGKDEGIVERCIRFLSNHEVKIGLPARSARSLVDESRSRKIRKILIPLLILLKLKAAIVIPAVLSIIALVAFKGMGAGLIALVIAGATAFKSALENSGSKYTYEIVPQLASPHWSRVGVDPIAQPQGYHTII